MNIFLQSFSTSLNSCLVTEAAVLRNRDKQYKKFKQSGRKTDKDNFIYARLSLEKIINNEQKTFLWGKTCRKWEQFQRTLANIEISRYGF